MRVVTFVCDLTDCGQKAVYRAEYDPKQKPVHVCLASLAWVAELAISSNNGRSGTLRLIPLQEIRGPETPAWAVPGRAYRCSDPCGYVFTLQADGTWKKTGKGYARTFSSWSDLEEREGDCAGHLERIYGARPASPDRSRDASER